jgi:hypothetical protein
VDGTAGGVEKRVEGVEIAVAGDEAAERLAKRAWDEHGHAVGEPCAATHEECVRAVPEVEQAIVVARGCPTGWAGVGIADLAICGDGEIERNVRFHGELCDDRGKRGLLFASGGYPYSFPVAEPTV